MNNNPKVEALQLKVKRLSDELRQLESQGASSIDISTARYLLNNARFELVQLTGKPVPWWLGASAEAEETPVAARKAFDSWNNADRAAFLRKGGQLID